MGVVSYRTILQRARRGLCSTYLASLNPEEQEHRVPIWIKRSEIRLPEDPRTPIIMVGPGTGLAIFKAFLEERKHMAQQGMCVYGLWVVGKWGGVVVHACMHVVVCG